MNLYIKHYTDKLYPLQDGVLTIIKNCKTHFYLTGGTALSRAYFNHRFSDDLDFFTNDHVCFNDEVKIILDGLRSSGFVWDTETQYFRTENFCSLYVSKEASILLKLDFVLDIPIHFGEIKNTNFYYRIDSLRNILSNKLSALFRYEAKDVADIREIALHTSFNWAEIIYEARQKEAGIEIPVIAEILKSMPREEFEAVKWKNKPAWNQFQSDIDIIINDMLLTQDNSLAKTGR